MKTKSKICPINLTWPASALWLCVLISAGLSITTKAASTLHVWQDSPNPTPPYSDWGTSATNIQDAVDAAAAGDEILVTNGVYQTGARAVFGMSNRVAVTKPVTVRSVNGPEVTIIAGYRVPGAILGAAAVRCVYLTNGSVLSGFTLTNGATQTSGDYLINQSGGGAWCESMNAVVTNCVLAGNSASVGGGGAYKGTLSNCTLTGNSASSSGGGAFFGTLNHCTLARNSSGYFGGGIYNGTLNHCTLTGNSADYYGGGACLGTLNDCTLIGNSATDSGGGAFRGTFHRCTLTSNSAEDGGGASEAGLYYCTLTGNSASSHGGGAYKGGLHYCTLTGNLARYGGGASDTTLNQCTLIGNSASLGGGAYRGTFNNCTLTGNSATNSSGGAFGGTLNNCIVYYNTAWVTGNNYELSTLNYCCTTPLPSSGTGNIISQPSFVNTNGWANIRLQSNSPCINAGNNAYASGSTDLDGRPRIVGGTVDIGAYEYQGPGMSECIGWLQQYDLPTDGSVDATDPDQDGPNNWQEWQADTDPTNEHSYFHIACISYGPPVRVRFRSSSSRVYSLLSRTNLSATDWREVPGQSDQPGSGGLDVLLDTNVVPEHFYRIGVRPPDTPPTP